MAEVFLARYVGPEGFEKRLVIKRVLPRLSDDRHLLRMFFEEAKTHVSLSHGNLVSVFDFGRVGNDYFIAMDYVHGGDLATLLAFERQAGRALSPSLVAYLGIEICRGLGYVHRRGFVHRDVSPRNVLLSIDGEVKLSDFGLVLKSESDVQGVRGTLAYTSPEQARGERVDARGDLYSVGVVLAEALAGKRLRDAVDAEAALALARAGAPIAIEGPLADVVARATQTDPDARFSGSEEMMAAIERASAALGRGRESAARELAAKMAELAPVAEAALALSEARGAASTIAGKAARASLAETYFRDNASVAFVDEVMSAPAGGRPAPRRQWLPWVAAMVAALVAGGFALRAARSPAVAAPPPAVAVSAPSVAAPAPSVPASAPSVAPSPSAPPASPVVASPLPTRSRNLVRRPATAESGTVEVQCQPWCVPYVDGSARGEDGRNHTLTLSAGRHRLEVRRLDDRLQRTVQVRAGQSQRVEFAFESKFQ